MSLLGNKEWEKNIDDDYYAYNKLEEWIREELDKAAFERFGSHFHFVSKY